MAVKYRGRCRPRQSKVKLLFNFFIILRVLFYNQYSPVSVVIIWIHANPNNFLNRIKKFPKNCFHSLLKCSRDVSFFLCAMFKTSLRVKDIPALRHFYMSECHFWCEDVERNGPYNTNYNLSKSYTVLISMSFLVTELGVQVAETFLIKCQSNFISENIFECLNCTNFSSVTVNSHLFQWNFEFFDIYWKLKWIKYKVVHKTLYIKAIGCISFKELYNNSYFPKVK